MDGFDWADFDREQPEVLKTPTKSSEEIERYTVPEDQDELERSVLFLSSSCQLQHYCAITNLPYILKEFGSDAVNRLLPSVKMQLTSKATLEMHEAGSSAFTEMVQAGLKTPVLVDTLLPIVLGKVSMEDADIRGLWVNTFLVLIQKLPTNVVQTQILDLALSTGDMSQSSEARVLSCQLVGALASLVDKKIVESKLLPLVLSLCQDTNHSVRCRMCEQLQPVAKAVGPELSKTSVLVELLELVTDESLEVRGQACTSLIAFMELVDDITRKTQVIPVIKKLFSDPSDDLGQLLARQVGAVISKLASIANDEDNYTVFVEFIKKLGQREEEQRALCAECFQLVIPALAATRFGNSLLVMFAKLCKDLDDDVRVACAANFHVVVAGAGKEKSIQFLKDPLIGFLQDSCPVVQGHILKHLQKTMAYFAVDSKDQRTAVFKLILDGVLGMEEAFNLDWRKQLDLVLQMEDALEYFTVDQVFDSFVPLLFKYMSSGAACVRQPAADMLIVLLTRVRSLTHRNDACMRLIKEFARGRSYSLRLLFCDACKAICERFSRHFFRTYFFDIALEATLDPVANVRLKVCLLLPMMKRSLNLPEDSPLLERLVSSMIQLLKDTDRDVLVAARQVADIIYKADITITPQEEAKDKKLREAEEAVLRAGSENGAEGVSRRPVDDLADKVKTEYRRMLMDKDPSNYGAEKLVIKAPAKPNTSTKAPGLAGKPPASGTRPPVGTRALGATSTLGGPKSPVKAPATSSFTTANKTTARPSLGSPATTTKPTSATTKPSGLGAKPASTLKSTATPSTTVPKPGPSTIARKSSTDAGAGRGISRTTSNTTAKLGTTAKPGVRPGAKPLSPSRIRSGSVDT